MSGSIRDAFLQKKSEPLKEEQVTIPEIGDVLVRGFTGTGRTRWERAQAKDPDHARGSLLVECVFNLDGTSAFKPEDADWLSDLPSCYTEPAIDVVFRLSGMTAEARAALGKPSAPAAGNETPSSSPSVSA
jgi:hypothetical protein